MVLKGGSLAGGSLAGGVLLHIKVRSGLYEFDKYPKCKER